MKLNNNVKKYSLFYISIKTADFSLVILQHQLAKACVPYIQSCTEIAAQMPSATRLQQGSHPATHPRFLPPPINIYSHGNALSDNH